MTSAADVIAVAVSQLGTTGDANNNTAYSDWYEATYPLAGNDFRGEDWCAIFVSWCLHQAGIGLQFAWVPTGVDAFKAYGLFDDKPRPGDVVFYDWAADGVATHTGIVESVDLDGTVHTIEGNRGTPPQVARHTIPGEAGWDVVLGFGHPAYQAAHVRTMYDSVNADAVPTDGDLYAGYVDGRYVNVAAYAARFPGKRIVRISVFASDIVGDVLDVEQWDATPPQVPGWLSARRSQGAWPTVYCNLSNHQAIVDAVNGAGLTQPPYWLAHYDNDPTIPAGFVAKQYQSTNDWDISSVADYWPGIDPAPLIGGTTLTPAAQVRAWIIEFWGREPSVAEQYGGEVYLAQHGDDLTIAFLYDHADAQAFRAKRGW